MEQNPCRESDGRSACHEITPLNGTMRLITVFREPTVGPSLISDEFSLLPVFLKRSILMSYSHLRRGLPSFILH